MNLQADDAGPLSGIRVLDLTHHILGPLATQTLGDMGADVIKVEPPEGDPTRNTGPCRHPKMGAMYLGVNRNKRSVVLDLRTPSGMDALTRLVETADVFVHSLRPSAARRRGIDYEGIARMKADIIYASAPGYRSDGPKRDLPAYDDIIQGESGLTGMNERRFGEPRYVPTVMADKFCGHVLASAISMALFQRERTGEGQAIEVPMLETMLAFNLAEHLWGGNYGQPMGSVGYTRALMAEHRPFRTSDGYICVMATTDAQWRAVFEAIARPELAQDPRFSTQTARSARFPELYGLVGDAFLCRTTSEWQERLRALDIPNGVSQRLEDLPSDPYLVETGFFQQYEHPIAGALVTTSIPVKFSRSTPAIRRPPPCLGEHTEEILGPLAVEALR